MGSYHGYAAVAWAGRLLLAACLGSVPASAQPVPASPADGSRHARMYAITSSKTFSNVNRNDAKASLKVWLDVVAQQRGFVVDSRVDIADSVGEVRERLQAQTVDVLMMATPDYLALEPSRLVVPVFTDARVVHGSPLYSYVLLVKAPGGAGAISDLHRKNILVASRGSTGTGLAWLTVLLAKELLGRPAAFFSSVKTPDKPQGCILPLFFGAVDACVVDEISLNLAREMNPQLGQLKVIARSRPLLEIVVATPVQPHPFQKDLIDTMLTLDQSPRGRQLLTVFKTDRLAPIQPGDLESSRELWKEYYRISNSAPDRLLAAGTATENVAKEPAGGRH